MDFIPENRQIRGQLCLAANADRAPGSALPTGGCRTRPRAGWRRVSPRLSNAELIAAGVSAELWGSLALWWALSGRMAKWGDHYYDYDHPMPSFLTQTFDELTKGGLPRSSSVACLLQYPHHQR